MSKFFSGKLNYNIAIMMFLLGFSFGCGNNESNKKEDFASSEQGIPDTSAIKIGEDQDTTADITSQQKSDNATESNYWLLIPGMSAGQTKLGEDTDSVYKRLGRPDGGDAAMQKAVAIWYTHHDSTAHSIAIYTARNTDSLAIARVLQIRITSPSFTTKNGIHPTSLLSDIQSKYTVKQTETYQDAGNNYKVYDSKDGIAFEVNSRNKCVAIVIHKVGIIGEGTYLKFRTTNTFIDR